MHSSTIVKALVLSISAIAIVARSLPERRSEIGRRAAGGYGLINTPTKRDGGDSKVGIIVSKTTTYVNDLKQSLEGMGNVAVSEGLLDRKDTASSKPINSALSPPLTAFRDLRGAGCTIVCRDSEDFKRDPYDCEALIETTYEKEGDFPVPFDNPVVLQNGQCGLGFINFASNITVYDFYELAEFGRQLNSDDTCNTPIRQCHFDNQTFIQLSGRFAAPLELEDAS